MSNLRFANAVEPGNVALQERIAIDTEKRQQGLPTVPSTIALEKATNPFLRYREPAILTSLKVEGKLAADASPVEAFAAYGCGKTAFKLLLPKEKSRRHHQAPPGFFIDLFDQDQISSYSGRVRNSANDSDVDISSKIWPART